MKLDYIMMHGREAEVVKNFIPEEILAGFSEESARYALCAVSENRVLGVAVFDAGPWADIQCIHALPEVREEVCRSLLSGLEGLLEHLGSNGIVFEIYEDDDLTFWEPVMDEMWFLKDQETFIYRIPLAVAAENPVLTRARKGKNIISLKEATDSMRRSFGNKLIQRDRFEHFMDGDYEGELSALCISEDREIEGCLLVSDLGMKEGFSIAYANTDDCGDKLALMKMIRFTLDEALAHYDIKGENPMIYVTAMNDISDSITHKLFPDAEIYDHCKTYVWVGSL